MAKQNLSKRTGRLSSQKWGEPIPLWAAFFARTRGGSLRLSARVIATTRHVAISTKTPLHTPKKRPTSAGWFQHPQCLCRGWAYKRVKTPYTATLRRAGSSRHRARCGHTATARAGQAPLRLLAFANEQLVVWARPCRLGLRAVVLHGGSCAGRRSAASWLGVQDLPRPAVILSGVEDAVMKPERLHIPEFDGHWKQAIAGPEWRTRQIAHGVLHGVLGDPPFEFEASFEGL